MLRTDFFRSLYASFLRVLLDSAMSLSSDSISCRVFCAAELGFPKAPLSMIEIASEVPTIAAAAVFSGALALTVPLRFSSAIFCRALIAVFSSIKPRAFRSSIS